MSSPHSVIFVGTSAFAVPALRALSEDKRFSVQLVVTQPDKPAGRKQELAAPPVKTEALKLNLPVIQPEKFTIAIEELRSRAPDFLVVVSYGQILKPEALTIPVIAPVNVHASLLPKLRGASPIQHAILLGMPETGVTVQRMVHALDAGPILTQTAVQIEPRETYLSLHDKLAKAGAELLVATLSIALDERPQDETGATVCRKLEKKDGFVHPERQTAEAIDRMVRALTPWPGVTWDDCKILETSLEPSPSAFALACAEKTTLFLQIIQPSGSKPMSGADFARGRHLSL